MSWQLLEEVCAMGRDAKFVCQKPQPKAEQGPAMSVCSGLNAADAASSDDEDGEEEIAASTHTAPETKEAGEEEASQDAQWVQQWNMELYLLVLVTKHNWNLWRQM